MSVSYGDLFVQSLCRVSLSTSCVQNVISCNNTQDFMHDGWWLCPDLPRDGDRQLVNQLNCINTKDKRRAHNATALRWLHFYTTRSKSPIVICFHALSCTVGLGVNQTWEVIEAAVLASSHFDADKRVFGLSINVDLDVGFIVDGTHLQLSSLFLRPEWVTMLWYLVYLNERTLST